jgi:hypothetical protein
LYLQGVMHWYCTCVPFFLVVLVGRSFEVEIEVSSPDAFVSLGNGHRGKLHSISVRVKSLHLAGEVSLTLGSVGLT